MRTVRINVQEPSPLDGVTPIDVNAPGVTVQQNDALGLIEVTLPPGIAFGSFDPGELLGDQTSSYWLQHLSVVRAGDGLFSPGSFVGIAGPFLTGIVEVLFPAPLIELDAQVDTHTGVVSEGICTLIPVDHKLVFSTDAAPDLGPFTIQVSLQVPPTILQTCQPPIVSPAFAFGGEN